MRHNPVGEPAATAAGTLLRRDCVIPRSGFAWFAIAAKDTTQSSRIHASRLVRTAGSGRSRSSRATPTMYGSALDQLLQTEPPCPACHVSDPLFESSRAFGAMRRSLPHRDAKPQKLSLLRSRHRALRLVDLEPQLVGQEPGDRGHDPFAGATAANIDVAVVGVPQKR